MYIYLLTVQETNSEIMEIKMYTQMTLETWLVDCSSSCWSLSQIIIRLNSHSEVINVTAVSSKHFQCRAIVLARTGWSERLC